MSDNLLSQQEIDQLLSGGDLGALSSSPAEKKPSSAPSSSGAGLSSEQKDALIEISSVLANSFSSVLSTILNNQIELSNPNIAEYSLDALQEKHGGTEIYLIEINYTEGLTGKFFYLSKKEDISIIADMMMGNEGTQPPASLDEILISATEEAFSQTLGSSVSSLSSMFNTVVNVGYPKLHMANIKDFDMALGSNLVEISYDFKMGDLIDGELFQILSHNFASNMAKTLKGIAGTEIAQDEPVMAANQGSTLDLSQLAASLTMADQKVEPIQEKKHVDFQPQPQMPPQQQMPPQMPAYPPDMHQQQMPPAGSQPIYPPPGYAPLPYGGPGQYPPPGYGYPPYGMPQGIPVTPVQFPNLSQGMRPEIPSNIDLIMDVPMQLVVELGRTKMLIRDILELGAGSVVELDRLAGESVDVLVNGKLIAKGEVVVIDENFGIRITSIVSPAERIKRLEDI